MIIRKAFIHEIDNIMLIYEEARIFMRSIGNGSQWGDTFPLRDTIISNINNNDFYVCVNEPAETNETNEIFEIFGVFYFKIENEPTYNRIDDGAWLNDEPYGVVHRLASSRKIKGTGAFCLDWCEKQCKNIRIDTHRDNITMRKVLEKSGYIYCGIIYVANGSERMAYQKIIT